MGPVLFFIFATLAVALLAVSVLAVVLVARWRRSSWEQKRQKEVRCAELRCNAKDGRQLRFSDAVPSRADDDLASSGGGSTTASSTDIVSAKVSKNAFHQSPLATPTTSISTASEPRGVAQPHVTPVTSTPTIFGAEGLEARHALHEDGLLAVPQGDLFDPPTVGLEDTEKVLSDPEKRKVYDEHGEEGLKEFHEARRRNLASALAVGEDDLPKPCEEGTPTVPRSSQPVHISCLWHDEWKCSEDVISIWSSMQGNPGRDAASAPAPFWPLRQHLGSLFHGVGGHSSSAPFDVGRHWSVPPPPKACISVDSASETSDSPGSSPRDGSVHEL